MIIFCDWIFKIIGEDYNGVTIFPFIFLKKKLKGKYGKGVDMVVLNHERIHLRQQAECLIILFYVIYGISYLINLAKGMNTYDAYKNIVFETEAYVNQKDMSYTENRRLWAWARKK